MQLSLAPLQGFTDLVFRRAFAKYIGGIDYFYTPFLVMQNSGVLKSSHKREVEPFLERKDDLIPQFLGGSVEEFQFFEKYFSDLGYEKMNWNLGCPFPMVTRKTKGSGLLPHADKIKSILSDGYSSKIDLSIKMRLGLEDKQEIFPVLEILKDMNLTDIIIHPRLGNQMYKGNADRDFFKEVQDRFDFPIAYNGDIETQEDFLSLKADIPNLKDVMIGRGILRDYWLPHKIKGLDIPSAEEKKQILRKMYAEIFDTYSSFLSGDTQLLQKVKPFWEYFSSHFDNERKVFKGIKKSGGFKKYEQAVAFAFQQNVKE
ncbi:tRNA-dihydrouridine synthase family protein [Labilibaculum sp. DW002]|uniref:tRNA-dihydrouridine synthase n=1 Tax=Paralabilibaculum antarcticum TaxID=2912572 RepID=A0ABT5VTK1_9BACT|nr:tRNA-dihydrouridine synthase family protein [Labilibaculum sp. DW002]MDE5418733.1 tRNA-dihydrouridine synthase family protein [Labilibaculum sp. DW002]